MTYSSWRRFIAAKWRAHTGICWLSSSHFDDTEKVDSMIYTVVTDQDSSLWLILIQQMLKPFLCMPLVDWLFL